MYQMKTIWNQIIVYFYFPTKNIECRFKKVNLAQTFTPYQKNCVRCNSWKCALYGGFSLTVWPWFGQFCEKISAITRYPLYSMSATDKLDCRRIAKEFAVKLIRFGCMCTAILIKWKIRQFGVWIWYRSLLTDNIIDFLIFSVQR